MSAAGGSDWLRHPPTRDALGGLDAVLLDAAAADDLHLRMMTHHVIERGGKRLRPALLFLAASFGRGDRQRLLRAAAALELTHVASLYHDDIMDRAAIRRGGATTNARWGNAQAAFAGTFLFARASELWAGLGPEANAIAADASVALCTGQLREVENAYNLALDEATHLSILEQKTATLFELPCRLGALLAGVPPEATRALTSFGRALGLAFQIADDALDLAGTTAEIGKAAGNDLREGVHSLPVLRALRDGASGERLGEVLGQMRLTDDDIEEALRLVAESGAVEEALDVARAYAAQAQEALAPLHAGPARDSLAWLAAYAVERSM